MTRFVSNQIVYLFFQRFGVFYVIESYVVPVGALKYDRSVIEDFTPKGITDDDVFDFRQGHFVRMGGYPAVFFHDFFVGDQVFGRAVSYGSGDRFYGRDQ